MIRTETQNDLPTITRLLNHYIATSNAVYEEQAWNVHKAQTWFDARQAAGFPVLVYEVGGTVLGYGSYGTFRARIGYRFTVEHSVYADPEHQRKGIGKALLEALIAQARADGLHCMIGAVDASNAGSVAFHEKFGFTQVGTFREVGRKNGTWLDVCFVQLRL